MFPSVLIILHFTRFLFTDSALVISLWKNYDKKFLHVTFTILFLKELLLFSFTCFFYASPLHLTRTQRRQGHRNSTGEQETCIRNKVKGRTESPDLRLSGLGNTAEKVFEMSPVEL